MSRAPRVVTAGDLFVDIIMSGFERWPEPGKEVFATHFHRDIGGGAMITACGLARLEVPTAVSGIVGSDTSDWILKKLEAHGVETQMIQIDVREPTALTVVATGPKDRVFLTYVGANRGLAKALTEAAAASRFAAASHLHLACAPDFDSSAELFAKIQADGRTVSLDVGWREDWLSHANARDVLRNVNIFFPNESEAHRLTGEEDPRRILQKFDDAGISRVALKLGSSGAALLWDGEIFFTRPHPVKPVDTTGAGDSFDAGFLYGWINGHSPQECLRIAAVCGAISTQAFGGIDGFPTPEHLKRELARGEK